MFIKGFERAADVTWFANRAAQEPLSKPFFI